MNSHEKSQQCQFDLEQTEDLNTAAREVGGW